MTHIGIFYSMYRKVGEQIFFVLLNIAKNVASERARVTRWREARGVSGLEVISG